MTGIAEEKKELMGIIWKGKRGEMDKEECIEERVEGV